MGGTGTEGGLGQAGRRKKMWEEEAEQGKSVGRGGISRGRRRKRDGRKSWEVEEMGGEIGGRRKRREEGGVGGWR